MEHASERSVRSRARGPQGRTRRLSPPRTAEGRTAASARAGRRGLGKARTLGGAGPRYRLGDVRVYRPAWNVLERCPHAVDNAPPLALLASRPRSASVRTISSNRLLQSAASATTAYWDPFWVRFGCAPLPVPWTTELGALAGHIALSLSGARPQRAQSGLSWGIRAAHSIFSTQPVQATKCPSWNPASTTGGCGRAHGLEQVECHRVGGDVEIEPCFSRALG